MINHTSSQKYDFTLSNGKELYRWSEGKSFTQALTETVIKPGSTVEFSEAVGKDVYDPDLAMNVLMKAYIVGTSSDFNIQSDGYEVAIH